MLSEVERTEAKKLFRLIPNEEVVSLARTVTKGQIHISTTPEAVDAILAYTESAAELLRRKKVKREILFKYLHNEGMPIAPSADKPAIMRRILEHWDSPYANDYLMDDDDDVAVATADVVQRRPNDDDVKEVANCSASNSWKDGSLGSTEEDQDMALQFSQWFYPMLNACHPLFPFEQKPPEAFAPNHFFRDANLLLVVATRDDERRETFTDSESVCRRLMDLTRKENVIFNPNLEPTGVKGFSDPHGRRVVIVCGTLHSADKLVGLFEQQFGLARDPFSNNNWKIKFTRLVLSASKLDVLPTLDMTRKMLSI